MFLLFSGDGESIDYYMGIPAPPRKLFACGSTFRARSRRGEIISIRDFDSRTSSSDISPDTFSEVKLPLKSTINVSQIYFANQARSSCSAGHHDTTIDERSPCTGRSLFLFHA